MFYTGVGSRETPKHIQDTMAKLATKLCGIGYTLRSGGAGGADLAFENGVKKAVRPMGEIYLPWNGFQGRRTVDSTGQLEYLLMDLEHAHPLLMKVMDETHWDRLGRGGRNMHLRNVYQVLGKNLNTPSRFLVCWTKDAKDIGGTATAIKLARLHNVPVYNMANKEDLRKILEYVK